MDFKRTEYTFILRIILHIILAPNKALTVEFTDATKNENFEMQLVDHLLSNYSTQARPVIDPQAAVNVTFGIEIIHLIKVVSIYFLNLLHVFVFLCSMYLFDEFRSSD